MRSERAGFYHLMNRINGILLSGVLALAAGIGSGAQLAWGLDPVTPSATPSTVSVSLTLGRASGLAGGEVTVPLLFNSTPNRGVSVFLGELLFDSTKLTFVRMVDGEATKIDGFETLFPNPLPEDGTVPGTKVLPFIVFDAALEDPAIFGLSNGVQALVTFRINAGVATGPIPLTLTNVVLTDSTSIDAPLEIINFTVIPGEIMVDLPPPPPMPPQITSQPGNASVNVGQAATFTVGLAANPLPPTFQWKKGTTNLTNGGNISGATTATLTISSVAVLDAGAYSVVVANVAGSVTSNPATLTVNQAPQVSIASVSSVVLGGTVTLDGTVSDDQLPNPPGVVTTRWSLVRGPTGGIVRFGNDALVDTTVTFTGAAGSYVLRLSADDDGVGPNAAVNAEVTVVVNPLPHAPSLGSVGTQRMAEAGAPLTVLLRATDEDQDRLSYRVEGLPSFGRFADHGDGTATLVFTPGFADAGRYEVTVTVQDPGGLSDQEIVRLEVENLNRAPIALAIGPESVMSGERVTLDGLGSFDPDGESLAYSWRQTGGSPTVVLESPESGQTRFTAPTVNIDTELIFELTVKDPSRLENRDTVGVTVKPPPIVPGDLDGDGRKTLRDLRAMLSMMMGDIPLDLSRADLIRDGRLSLADVRALLRQIVNQGQQPSG